MTNTTEFTDPLTESEFDHLRRQLDRLICQQEDIDTLESRNRAEALAKADLVVEVISDIAKGEKCYATDALGNECLRSHPHTDQLHRGVGGQW
jgi:cytochrome c-type biogenesis protein CcmH/NrfF